MNIAVIGGGNRCRILLELFAEHKFQNLDPKVIAVADENENAPGMIKAREKGIYTTNDYYEFFDDDDIAEFLKTNYPEFKDTFNAFSHTIQKIDFFRYLAIYKYGGIYLDIDMEIHTSLTPLLKPSNAAELLGQPNIDGGLIGGASLKPDDFAAIVQAGL